VGQRSYIWAGALGCVEEVLPDAKRGPRRPTEQADDLQAVLPFQRKWIAGPRGPESTRINATTAKSAAMPAENATTFHELATCFAYWFLAVSPNTSWSHCACPSNPSGNLPPASALTPSRAIHSHPKINRPFPLSNDFCPAASIPTRPSFLGCPQLIPLPRARLCSSRARWLQSRQTSRPGFSTPLRLGGALMNPREQVGLEPRRHPRR
jgi:hypothetical protein